MISKRPREDHGFEAVPAYVVADKTDKTSKRLGYFALGMLVLFFAMGGYIQSSQNNDNLAESDAQRAKLIDTVDEQTKLIRQLQVAIRDQNALLKLYGIPTVQIPNNPANPIPRPTPTPSATQRSQAPFNPVPRPGAGPTAARTPAPQPSSSPAPPPPQEPNPSPSPTPVVPAGETVCNLVGICLNR